MSARHWLKRLLPRVLTDLVRPPAEPPAWRGVYPHWRDVPAERAEFTGDLIDEMVATTTRALAQWRAGEKPYLWHEPLALLAGTTAGPGGRLRVLDFGGGVGSGFVQLISSLPAGASLDYLVVDSEEMCAAGRSIFSGDSRVRFATVLPDAGSVDLVYVNGVLPYIDDYRGLLRQLAALGAGRLLLARLAAGPGPTFASQQINVPGRIFPYWFLNFGEVEQTLRAAGYRLACDSYVDRTYNQSNLPATHRVERFRNVLFTKMGSGAQ